MPSEPQISILSVKHRQRFFWLLVLIFMITLPSLIFYTTGYRLSFEDDETSIVTTGGVYITTDNLDVDVYLDEEQIERPRLFRSAYYIQNIEAGKHRIVVQRPDLHTWVKELPVDAYMVAEAAAFNMPRVPHVRPITEYVTATGTPVVFETATTPATTTPGGVFEKATSTVPFFTATVTATSTFRVNDEFLFVESLFSTSSATTSRSVFERIADGIGQFGFATTSPDTDESASTTATSTTESVIERGDMRLVEHGRELYAAWTGSINSIPHYFCVTDTNASTTAFRYGEHVAAEVERLMLSTTTPAVLDGNRICRPEVKLDRLRQDVYFYDFFPNTNDLVLLQLEDGLYVTEIDDRAWQNTQLLYPGTDFTVFVENGIIYLQEDGYYFQLVTEIELN